METQTFDNAEKKIWEKPELQQSPISDTMGVSGNNLDQEGGSVLPL